MPRSALRASRSRDLALLTAVVDEHVVDVGYALEHRAVRFKRQRVDGRKALVQRARHDRGDERIADPAAGAVKQRPPIVIGRSHELPRVDRVEKLRLARSRSSIPEAATLVENPA